MKNKLLLPLTVLLLAALGVAVLVLTSGPAGRGEHLAELGPGSSSEALAPATSRPDELSAARADEPEPEREAVAEEPAEPREKVAREAASLPSNARWVEGRVIFPAKLPLDAGDFEVIARGRRFGGKDDPRREYLTSLARDGRFRVAFAKSTRKGWIDVKGRYLYMDEKLALDMRDLPLDLVVEPKLGGLVRGKLTPPLGKTWTPEVLDGARATLSKWSGGRLARSIPIAADGSFVLTGVPPASSYNLSVKSKFWAEYKQGDVQVKAGEVTELEGQLRTGAQIAGRVVDRSGAGRAAVSVELMCQPTDGGWHHQTVQTEDDGGFVFRGVVDGEVTLTASPGGGLPVDEELGILHDGDVRRDVTIEIDEGRTISGLVRWPDGKPAAGAWVSVEQERETSSLRMMMMRGKDGTKVEADGSFSISGLEDATCIVRASAKSVLESDKKRAEEARAKGRRGKLRRRGSTYRVKLEDIEPGTTGLVLVLEPGDTVRGKAVDDQGQGLSRFLIIARPETGAGSQLDDGDGFERIVLTLDGSFEVDGLRDGSWKLSARADDHARSETFEITSPGAGEVEFVLPRLGRVHGVVRGPGGEPISGASLYLEDAGEDESQAIEVRGNRWGEDATSDEEGRFEAKDVAPGRKVVFANMEGFGQSSPQYVTLEPGGTVEGVSLRLRAGARIRGQVHAAAGQIAKREISVQGRDGVQYWETVVSDSSGRFEVEGLSPGKYRLELQGVSEDEVVSGGGGFLSAAWTRSSGEKATHNSIQYVELGEGDRAQVVLGSPPNDPIQVTGRVTSGGEPVAGYAVACQSNEDSERNRDSTVTGTGGEYALTVSGAGSYSFSVGTNPNVVRSTHEVSKASARIDFELPGCALEGSVQGASGEALSDARLQLMQYRNAAGEEVAGRNYWESSDSEGIFRFEHLEAGSYYLRASKSGDWNWRRRRRSDEFGAILVEGLTVAEGQTLAGVELQLGPAGTISGTVLGSDGLGLSRVEIEVLTASGRTLLSRTSRGDSSDGAFEVSGVGEGTFVVRAKKGGVVGEGVQVRVYPDEESEVQLLLDTD